jgi:hypothetical protein
MNLTRHVIKTQPESHFRLECSLTRCTPELRQFLTSSRAQYRFLHRPLDDKWFFRLVWGHEHFGPPWHTTKCHFRATQSNRLFRATLGNAPVRRGIGGAYPPFGAWRGLCVCDPSINYIERVTFTYEWVGRLRGKDYGPAPLVTGKPRPRLAVPKRPNKIKLLTIELPNEHG